MKKNKKSLLKKISFITIPTFFLGVTFLSTANNYYTPTSSLDFTNSRQLVRNNKVISVNTIKMNAVESDDILMNLDTYFAQELLSTPLNSQLEEIYNKFNQQLIALINKQPDLFFDVVVTNPNSMSYIEPGSNLVTSIFNNDNKTLIVNCRYLVDNNGLEYSDASFSIEGFSIENTAPKTQEISIKGYEYFDPVSGQTIIPSTYNVYKFQYLQNVDKILINFINKNIKNLLDKSFSMTTCDYINNNFIINDLGSTLSIKFLIKNYVDRSGNLVFANQDFEYSVTITDFQPLEKNDKVTEFKNNDLSLDSIMNEYKGNSFDYPLLASLNNFFIEEYTANGYKYQQLLNELNLAINNNASFWLINPVTKDINQSELSLVNLAEVTTITVEPQEGSSNLKQLKINISVLTQPKFVDQQASVNDYKNLNLIIKETTNNQFGSAALYEKSSSFINLNDPFKQSFNYEQDIKKTTNKTQLNELTVEQIEYYVDNNVLFLQNIINEYITSNKNELFANVLKTTKIVFSENKVGWSNKQLVVKFSLQNYFEKGQYIDNETLSKPFTLTIHGFENKDNSQEVTLVIALSVTFSIIFVVIILLIIFLIFKKQKKKKQKSSNTKDFSGTYSNWKG